MLAGLVAACGLESVLRLFDSRFKKAFAIVGFSVLAGCFLYQFQFRDRLSWIGEAHYSLFDSLYGALGYGGVFLLGFLYRLDLFKSRSPIEKLLSVGFLVSLSLICILKIWVDRYLIVLMPFSLWLSSIYFEKFMNELRQSVLVNRFAFLALSALIFVGVMGSSERYTFFEGFRLGNAHGLKNLMSEMKSENMIISDTKVLCITDTFYYTEKPVELYAKMYWGKDICTNYSQGFSSQSDISKYDYLIHLRANSVDVFEGIPGAEFVSKRDLQQLSASDNYELYKIGEVPES